jgi:hypothetical protein
VIDFPQSDPYSHYIFFNKIGWCKKIVSKFRIFDNLLVEHSSLKQISKLLFQRIIIYQLWGSLVVLAAINILESNNIINIPQPFNFVVSGIFPIAYIILFLGIIHIGIEFFSALLKAFKKPFEHHRRVKKNYGNVLSYLTFIIGAPFLFLLYIFLEVITRFFMSFIYYQYIGVKLFLEMVWLFFNLIFRVVTSLVKFILSLIQNFKPSGNNGRKSEILKLEVKE